MPAQRIIPNDPVLHSEIMVKVTEGLSREEIADWLTEKLGRAVGLLQVREAIAKVREMRAEIVKTALTDQAGKTAVADLSHIGRLLSDAREIQCAAMPDLVGNSKRRKKGNPLTALRAIETQKKLIELRFAVLGIGNLGKRGQGEVPLGAVIILPAEES